MIFENLELEWTARIEERKGFYFFIMYDIQVYIINIFARTVEC